MNRVSQSRFYPLTYPSSHYYGSTRNSIPNDYLLFCYNPIRLVNIHNLFPTDQPVFICIHFLEESRVDTRNEVRRKKRLHSTAIINLYFLVFIFSILFPLFSTFKMFLYLSLWFYLQVQFFVNFFMDLQCTSQSNKSFPNC